MRITRALPSCFVIEKFESAQIRLRPQIKQKIMAHFIELHIKHNENPIYINTDAIAFVENDNGRVYVNFLNQRISSSSCGNSLSNVSSYWQREEVAESYSFVKSKIEE